MSHTKKCSNCEKWMIKWEDRDIILASNPPQIKIMWKCGCGNSEFYKYETLGGIPKTFNSQWEETKK